jgi:hypothetical protein
MALSMSYTADDLAFKAEVDAFLRDHYPQDLKDKDPEDYTREDYVRSHKALAAQGYAAPEWPVEWGGKNWTPTQRHILNESLAEFDTVPILPFGTKMVAPVIYTFGDEAQKQRFLPKIYNGDELWCQGYSEPGAGSDLASLKTKAVRQGDVYVVDGMKTWTTLAQYADWIFVLVRTDPNAAKPQQGISFILVDMKSPGITVRPIYTLDGAHEVNEVYFDSVEVPVENLVGEENKGWTYAKFLLAHERSGIAGVGRSRRALSKIKHIATKEFSEGEPLIVDEDFARKVAEVEMDLDALEVTELRSLTSEESGKGPGPESSILKIKGTEIQQRLAELTMEAVGHYAHPYFRDFRQGTNAGPVGPDYAHTAAPVYFNMRKTSIYGGSNEIQRGIIAKMILGL